MKRALLLLSVAGCLAGTITGCSRRPDVPDVLVSNGDASRGRQAIDQFGCGACHDIPGVRDAAGMVGPPLTHWSQRRVIAGELENTPDRLITWITVPQTVKPGNAMPNMGISDAQARDIAAYLYSIK